MVFSKIAEELILSIAKEDGLELAKLLNKMGKTDEFTLAEKFGRDVNYVRSLLYSLYEYKIVSYSRKRDPKKMWWIYYWEISEERINELLTKNLKKEILELRAQKEKMSDNQIFECKECGRIFNFESAAENNFLCPADSDVLQYVDSSFLLNEIEEKTSDLESKLKEIEKEQETVWETRKKAMKKKTTKKKKAAPKEKSKK
jgi:transcription initiation factor TFIIE subunit alpha